MILAAIATLDDILTRMATHRQKNTSLFADSGLRAWEAADAPDSAGQPGPEARLRPRREPARARAATRSTSRFEYPHSLSYQATTLTCVPSTTAVRPASKIAEYGDLTMSEETSGSSL